eukprot:700324-Prorocentrum_lima.AAC.1
MYGLRGREPALRHLSPYEFRMHCTHQKTMFPVTPHQQVRGSNFHCRRVCPAHTPQAQINEDYMADSDDTEASTDVEELEVAREQKKAKMRGA